MKVKIKSIDSEMSSPTLREAGYFVGQTVVVTADYFRNKLDHYWDEARQMAIFPEECEVISHD